MGSSAITAVKERPDSRHLQPKRIDEDRKASPEEIATKKAEDAKKDTVIGKALLVGAKTTIGEHIRASVPSVLSNNFISNNIWDNPSKRYVSSNNLFAGKNIPEGAASHIALSQNGNSKGNSDGHKGRDGAVFLSAHLMKDTADGLDDIRKEKLELIG